LQHDGKNINKNLWK